MRHRVPLRRSQCMRTRSGMRVMKVNHVTIHKAKKVTDLSFLTQLRKLLKKIGTVTRDYTSLNTYIVSYSWENAIVVQNICDDYLYLKNYNDVKFQYERKGDLYSGLPNGYQKRYYGTYSD